MQEEDGSDGRTVHAMGERVAIVETKIVSLKDDTAVIRATLHGVNGEFQKSVMQMARLVVAFEAIAEQAKALPGLIVKVDEIYNLRTELKAILDEKLERRGAWKAYATAGAAIVGAVAVLGTISTGTVWLIEKIMASGR